MCKIIHTHLFHSNKVAHKINNKIQVVHKFHNKYIVSTSNRIFHKNMHVQNNSQIVLSKHNKHRHLVNNNINIFHRSNHMVKGNSQIVLSNKHGDLISNNNLLHRNNHMVKGNSRIVLSNKHGDLISNNNIVHHSNYMVKGNSRIVLSNKHGNLISNNNKHMMKDNSSETALVSKKIDSLTQNIHDMYVTQMPKRTNQTNKPGRNIIVETNMLKLIFAQNFQTNIIHYDVIITPDKPKFLLRTVFEEFRKKQCPKRYPAFDGKKNAYSAQNLPFGDKSKEEEIKIFDVNTGREKNFKIYLNKVASLDLSWLKNLKCDLMDSERNQKCIQALEIILRHGPAYQYTVIGRSLFQQPEPGRVVSLSNGLDLWVGVFQSVVIGSKPYLNIDVAHKGFPKSQSVIDLMKELCNVQDLTPKVVEQNLFNINKFLKGLKIQYELPGQPTTKRTYRVNKLVNSARENKFRLEDQTLYSVEQYFLQIKKYTIKYPTLPCLWVGSQKNSIYLPAELCTIIAGQVIQKDMNKIQTSKMIRETATDTRKRKEKIMNNFANMNLNQQPTLMDEFHFSVNPEFEKIPARVLEAPKLQYKEKEVNVKKGIWKAEKFFIPCILPKKSWTILNLDNRIYNHDLYNLYEKLQNGGKFLNMEIAEALTPFANLTIETNINKIIEYFNDKKKQKILLVVVILPNLDNAYSIVKQICELQIHEGIVTQCIKNQTLKKLNDSTIGNILLKINSKLNGINHIITPTCRPNCLRKPCMIIGADVTHPSPDAINTPSIAAVAASHDPNAFKYNVEIRLQSPREEIIQDLEEIMIIQLKYFFGITRQKPQKLIFYRDGVSEGHLKQVIHKELSAIKRAIARLEKSNDIKIPITFLVVQKRHHVRFFPTDVKNSDDKNFNVQAGTIVDTEITHPTHIDFYLVSHTSIQGTARPTKYRCICNENQMPENEIEQLTYYLCHMFARCTRSVSYPAPTYYAHLAAFRARALIHNTSLNIENLQEEQRKKMTLKIIKVHLCFLYKINILF
ncbi:protein argonaute-2 isoform X2 [Apis florea]|uniref:protein argonaute-2 isoform X2 n=1 Tax=Apis florea TaxID=7463 RepID=UPI0012FF3F43|nr:protein argonaute-2 isoform X2 [Apis florea]